MLIKLPELKKLTGSDLPIDAEQTLLALDRHALEMSLYDFTVAAWSSIDPAPFVHGGFVLQAICEHLEACVDVGAAAVLAHIGTGRAVFVCVLLAGSGAAGQRQVPPPD